MSQWTHVLGLIRYDYWAQNCWCSDTDGKPEYYNVKEKINSLNKIYKHNVPTGSEGSLEVSITNSNRGPIVRISGDLRDFGLSDVKGIIKWLNTSHKEVEKENKSTNVSGNILTIRDSVINIDVEYYKNNKIVLFSQSNRKFKIVEITKEKED